METPIRSSGLAILLSSALLLPASASAISIGLGAGDQGISDIDYSQSANTITIQETWESTDPGSVEIGGLGNGIDYTIIKEITNESGSAWSGLSNELLDPSGDPNDQFDREAADWIPEGFSHSNDLDGLSFAQGSEIARSSDLFENAQADEVGTRDFIDFQGGILGDGETATIRYGITDSSASVNEPFLLSQRADTAPIPAPTTPALLGIGLLGLVWLRRKQFA